MEKKMSDEELDRLLEEQFLNEVDAIEDALFSDEFEEYEEETDEEVDAAYEDLVERLKARGEYREEEEKVISMPEKKMPNTKTYEKKGKTSIWDSKQLHRIIKIAGMAVVCILSVCAASMTSEANREYFINTMKYMTGDDTKIIVDNVGDNDKVVKTEEDSAVQEIEEKLKIKIPRLYYRPKEFVFFNYEIGEFGNFAFIEYKYQDMLTALYVQRKDDVQDSLYFDFHGEKTNILNLDNGGIQVEIFEIKGEAEDQPSFIAQWNRNNVFYLFTGKIEKDEFIEIVRNILF